MSGLLMNLRNTVVVSVILALGVVFAFYKQAPGGVDPIFWQAILRWLHVMSGVMWIGLLWYFNFVQTRKMPEIPAELKPAISKYIAPEALFWFRYGALSTWIWGLALAWNRGYLVQAISLDGTEGFTNPGFMLIGLGMWLGTIMFLFVWGVIWPNQKIALGMKEADADKKAAAGKTATLFSRVNMLLSIPMLACMTMYQTIFG